ncbi:hypothetical protein PACTADRAFT_50776 [Pachysolen tannophilus NRRL Y-2460]|uniref:Transcription factor domain-containing protein n=1 Tax=Pachysolen tannophilus NRRL Y-2460 TaxID=669874 RepID=A0A1E4TT87_PACTA|nr:hypothetical protein PACTADRAFT_50776 [Pachysolen tannophilus NRRL Y-2460]
MSGFNHNPNTPSYNPNLGRTSSQDEESAAGNQQDIQQNIALNQHPIITINPNQQYTQQPYPFFQQQQQQQQLQQQLQLQQQRLGQDQVALQFQQQYQQQPQPQHQPHPQFIPEQFNFQPSTSSSSPYRTLPLQQQQQQQQQQPHILPQQQGMLNYAQYQTPIYQAQVPPQILPQQAPMNLTQQNIMMRTSGTAYQGSHASQHPRFQSVSTATPTSQSSTPGSFDSSINQSRAYQSRPSFVSNLTVPTVSSKTPSNAPPPPLQVIYEPLMNTSQNPPPLHAHNIQHTQLYNPIGATSSSSSSSQQQQQAQQTQLTQLAQQPLPQPQQVVTYPPMSVPSGVSPMMYQQQGMTHLTPVRHQFVSSFEEQQHQYVLPSQQMGEGQEIPSSPDSSSSSSSTSPSFDVIHNNIYSRKYLYSLMKKLQKEKAKSSSSSFFNISQLLEIDSENIEKSDGSDPYICDPLDALLLDNFINNISAWLDIYCSVPFFTKLLPHIALFEESGMIMNCMLSCGALYLHRDQPNTYDSAFSMKYYNTALKQMSMELGEKNRILTRTLISSVLLNLYESFAGDFLDINQLNHITGSRIILLEILNNEANSKKVQFRKKKNRDSNSFLLSEKYVKKIDLNKVYSLENTEFLESLFWIITINDLTDSLKWELPNRWSLQNPNTTILTLAPPSTLHDQLFNSKISEYLSRYFDVDFKSSDGSFCAEKDDLWWLRKSAFDLEMINDFLNQNFCLTQDDFVSQKMVKKWIELKKIVDSFGKAIPQSLRKIGYNKYSDNKYEAENGEKLNSNFPMVLFKDETSALININYHLSCLLLYESLITRTELYIDGRNTSSSIAYLFSERDFKFLSVSKNIHKLMKFHSKQIVAILLSYYKNLTVWALSLGHFKYAVRYLTRDPKYFKELDSLIVDIQVYTRTRLFKTKI